MKPIFWFEAAGMVIIYAIGLALDLTWVKILAFLLGYLVVVAVYELYLAHRLKAQERAAKRRARRTDTGLYGWPLGDVEQASTVTVRPVAVAPSVRTRVDVEPIAPAVEPEVEPELVAEAAGVTAHEESDWPESAPVVDDAEGEDVEAVEHVEEVTPPPVVEAAPFEEPAPEPEPEPDSEPEPEPDPEPEVEPEPEPEPAPEPEPEPAPEPEREPERAPEPTPEPEPVAAAAVEREPAPPAEEPRRRMPWRRDEVREAPVRAADHPQPEPVAEPVAAPAEPPAPAPAPALAPAARGSQWNLWELERAMQADPQPDTDRAYERSALIVFLRDYASSDGQLPPEFDELVRDAFAELLAVR
jgi:hypothetical protein